MLSGFLAVLYIAALWYGSAGFVSDGTSIAERLRVVIACGIALPGVLALFGLFYVPVLWFALAALCLYRARRKPIAAEVEPAAYILLCVALAMQWTALCRPLLDGDSLLYHLPNAVAFVQTHSIWQSSAPYWVYPPASELFASGIFAASGRWALPLAGIAPALLITARLYKISRNAGVSAIGAAATPLAFIATPVVAFQAGTLQNDLWLAAFILEIVSSADSSPVSVAIGALLKPVGWIEAGIAALFARTPWQAVTIGFIPFAFWIVRDTIVLAHAGRLGFTVLVSSRSTIAANFGVAAAQLAHGISVMTPQAFVWLFAMAAGFFFHNTRRYATLAIALLTLYVFMPSSYKAANFNYVIDASSLRYALPALACGAACLAMLMGRSERLLTAFAFAVAVWGAASTLVVFWNDAYTRCMPLIAIVVAIAGILLQRLLVNASVAYAAFAAALVIAGSSLAGARHAGFYADWMRDAKGRPSAAFAWLEQHQPQRIIAENIRIGAIEMNVPSSRVTGAWPDLACSLTRHSRAVLFVGTNEDARGATLADLLLGAHRCGRTLFQDRTALIVAP